MADFVHLNQLVVGETDEDGMNKDELQTTDASFKVEEDKDKQSTIVTRIKVQTDDLAIGE